MRCAKCWSYMEVIEECPTCAEINESEKMHDTRGNVRVDFERWVRGKTGQSTERYRSFPYSYKISELQAQWTAWDDAERLYGDNE